MMPKNTARMIQVTAGSFFRVIWYACHTWWYQRVFFTLGVGAASGVLSRAMGPKSTDRSAAVLTPSAGEQARSLLARRRRLGEVREGLGDRPAVAAHRLAPQAAGAVRRADQRART